MKTLTTILALVLGASSYSATAAGASENASEASKHSVLAVGHGVASTAQVTSAVALVPLAVVASVGEVSGKAANSLAEVASGKPNNKAPQELEISEITVTIQRSPKQAMADKKEK